ncbi:hypothetical protein RRG08_029880 [Elysia crispata]|uniref:Uncharacterized protein n=1 Tax=Elysia crispata TaxID=231223 RepID=A0AAE0YJD4_9GAST|nr:hypothetical protein RRG08_029880 [Elysia crispata]
MKRRKECFINFRLLFCGTVSPSSPGLTTMSVCQPQKICPTCNIYIAPNSCRVQECVNFTGVPHTSLLCVQAVKSIQMREREQLTLIPQGSVALNKAINTACDTGETDRAEHACSLEHWRPEQNVIFPMDSLYSEAVTPGINNSEPKLGPISFSSIHLSRRVRLLVSDSTSCHATGLM